MNESRRQILNMLAEHKITAEEAERLLAALEASGSSVPGGFRPSSNTGNGTPAEAPRIRAKYLRVLVEGEPGAGSKNGPVSVNIRVPMQLLRAGVRLASLIPVQAHQHFDEAMSKQGIPLTLSQIRPENLEELVDSLDELTVDVAAKESDSNVKVKVFSE